MDYIHLVQKLTKRFEIKYFIIATEAATLVAILTLYLEKKAAPQFRILYYDKKNSFQQKFSELENRLIHVPVCQSLSWVR